MLVLCTCTTYYTHYTEMVLIKDLKDKRSVIILYFYFFVVFFFEDTVCSDVVFVVGQEKKNCPKNFFDGTLLF